MNVSGGRLLKVLRLDKEYKDTESCRSCVPETGLKETIKASH